MFGVSAKGKAMGTRMRPVEVNGQPGAMIFDAQDRLISVFTLDVADGFIQAVRSVINPDKLRHLGLVSDVARLPLKPQ